MWSSNKSPGFTYRPRLKLFTDGKNNTFNPETFEAVSYRWWTYVKKFGKIVVFNDYNYSSTTNNHQWNMKSLLEKLNINNVVYISQKESLSEGIILNQLYKNLYLAEFRLKMKGRKKLFYETQKEIIDNTKKEIRQLRKIGGKTTKDLKTLKINIIESEKTRLVNQREESRKQREKRKELMNQYKDQFNSLESVEA